jgi:hypothetical protein
MADWKILRNTTTDDGDLVELRYAEFGKGKTLLRKWLIFRNGVKAGYAVSEEDAAANFARVVAGYVRNPETGNYEKA